MKKLNNIKLPKVKTPIKLFLVGVVVFASIGFVEKNQQEKVCNKIIVSIDNQLENHFINEQDVIGLITDGGNKQIIGTPLYRLPLKEIEKAVNDHKYVENAEVFKDLSGNLMVNVNQSRPVARIIRPYAADAYISQLGEIIPVSRRYTARVVIIRGGLMDQLVEEGLTQKNYGLKLFSLINYINQHPFWRAQIAEVEIDKKGNITMFPQIGKQKIFFGKPENLEEKFNKVNIFFKRILPYKGWNHYQKVNVNFKDQIICE